MDIETMPTPKPLGFLKDPFGDRSSGRLIKVLAFAMACVLALVGALKGIDLNMVVGLFLALAASAEIAQKTTGT